MVDLAKSRRVPTKWQSSGRPLFVRTVYVDGLRHAILSADDPVIQYVRTPPKGRRWSSSVVDQPVTVPVHSRDPDSELSCCLVKLALEQKVPTQRRRAEKKKYTRPTSTESSTSDDNCEDPSSPGRMEPSTFSRRGSSISERVLQWLDLAGRNEDTLPIDLNPRRYMSPPSRRRRTHVVSSAPARTRAPLAAPSPPPPRPPSIPLPLLVPPQTPKSETTSIITTTTTKLAPISKQLSTPRPQLHIFLPWPIEGTDDND